MAIVALVLVDATAGGVGRGTGRRRRPGRLYRVGRGALVVAQVLGAAVGIALVHATLRREVVGAMPWLSERPAQLVNDVVAVSGLLALVWASASRLDTRIFVIALLVMTAYRATASAWHLDHAPHGFQTTIQELVVAQFVAAAIGLLVFRATLGRRPRLPRPPTR